MEYNCEICKEKLPSQEQLAEHIQIHVEVKPIKSELFINAINNENSFEMNLQNYTNEEPFKCYVCEKNFINENSLKEHNLEMHCNTPNCAKRAIYENGCAIDTNIKIEVNATDNSDAFSAAVNQGTPVKMEKVEFVDCSYEEDFIKHETSEADLSDTQDRKQLFEIYKKEDEKGDCTM